MERKVAITKLKQTKKKYQGGKGIAREGKNRYVVHFKEQKTLSSRRGVMKMGEKRIHNQANKDEGKKKDGSQGKKVEAKAAYATPRERTKINMEVKCNM